MRVSMCRSRPPAVSERPSGGITRSRFGRSLLLLLAWSLAPAAAAPVLDETPAVEGEWGYRPGPGTVSQVTPPGFTWRPTQGIVSYELECGKGKGFQEIAYRAEGITMNVHCPPRVLPPGVYTWRYRGKDAEGQLTPWSQARTFEIAQSAVEMPLPTREELLARVPKTHPRLFMRPEDVARLRERARGDLKPQFDRLVQRCEQLLQSPPPTAEPPKYPPGTVRNSEEWRKIWWGNRTYTIAALDSAATLAFTRLIGGKEEYGQLARRILMECAKWDPKGSTGYIYNDEAGMPYNWGFSRTYTFVYDLLTEEERAICRRVMKIRGDEMYRHLYPRHLWRPYNSHSNRAWHKLGEIGIAFLGEVEGAEDWVWFAANVFANVYPVWSDDDGGWHEGMAYWASYLERFSFWADTMKPVLGLDAYKKPFFSQVGYYPMYLMPPGTTGGGFGDLTPERKAPSNARLVATFAAQAGNGHWQWYVEQVGGSPSTGGYIGFVRGTLPPVKPVPPDDLPTSRLFKGTGLAVLNTSLKHAKENVRVLFKSSPFGTQSHGYEANNAFSLIAYGERLLVQTGRRDSYGTPHHRDWMWSTRSVNAITVDGHGQVPHSAASRGEITAFKTTPAVDIVVGEAGDTYRVVPTAQEREQGAQERKLLDRFTRTLVFLKPDVLVVYDRLVAKQPSTFEYWLHAVNQFETLAPNSLRTQTGDVACDIDILTPAGLKFHQTNEYDPNPRPRITIREWHLTATTPEKRQQVEFVTLCAPRKASEAPLPKPTLESVDGGYVLRVRLRDGEATVLLPAREGAVLRADGLESRGAIVVQRATPRGRTRVEVP
ncbi:MAG TPA: DUF4962 domain-containing protein [Armatimonadota bacterium]|nr:DUF4962 domain-containing protein [Armatimonadota bacterium]